MAYMKLHCAYCGKSWEIYECDDWKSDAARTCPHCAHKVDRQTWHNQVLPAFGAVADANRELLKDHSGQHTPLFSFDVVANHLFAEQPQGVALVWADGRETVCTEKQAERIAGSSKAAGKIIAARCTETETENRLNKIIDETERKFTR